MTIKIEYLLIIVALSIGGIFIINGDKIKTALDKPFEQANENPYRELSARAQKYQQTHPEYTITKINNGNSSTVPSHVKHVIYYVAPSWDESGKIHSGGAKSIGRAIADGDEIYIFSQKSSDTAKSNQTNETDKTSANIAGEIRDYQDGHPSEKLTKFNADSPTISMPDNVTHVIFTDNSGKTVSGGNDLVSEAISSNHAIYVFSK